MERRDLLKSGALFLGAGSLPVTRDTSGLQDEVELLLKRGAVQFVRDNLDLQAAEVSAILGRFAHKDGEGDRDSYSRGGVVALLEQRLAELLGKEAAIFMPTGTLANHLALTECCRSRSGSRVIAGAESHVVNDAGDGLEVLGRVKVISLGPGAADFSLADVQQVEARASTTKVRTGIAALTIETPVRRMANACFHWDAMKVITAYGRKRGWKLHLDGARLFIEQAFTGRDVKQTARLFDTVYVSLYKNFHAPSGAVLAGPRRDIEGLYHSRRRYGGGLPEAWPYAAVALAFVDGMVDRLRAAIARFDTLKTALCASGSFDFEAVPRGTNVMHMSLRRGDPQRFRERLARSGIRLPRWNEARRAFPVKINESLNRREPEALAEIFLSAL